MPQIICPVCDAIVKRSEYLQAEFKDDPDDPDALYAANLVTHYRHTHLKQYDYAWRNPKDKKTGYTNVEHEEFRSEINRSVKKELIEALVKVNKWESVRGFLSLRDNDPELIDQINTILSSRGKKGTQSNTKKTTRKGPQKKRK